MFVWLNYFVRNIKRVYQPDEVGQYKCFSEEFLSRV